MSSSCSGLYPHLSWIVALPLITYVCVGCATPVTFEEDKRELAVKRGIITQITDKDTCCSIGL